MSASLIVLMDFSPGAEAALRYATGLARQLSARLVLLHLYHDPLLVTETALVTVPVEAYYQSQQEVTEHLQRLAQTLPVPAEVAVAANTIPEVVADAVQRYQPLLLVAGREHTDNFLDRLVSNLALPSLRAVRFPLLLVPERLPEPKLPTRVLVAADQHPFQLKHTSTNTKALFAALKAEPAVVHVAPDGPPAAAQARAALAYVRRTGLFEQVPDNRLYEVRDEDPAEGIVQAVADLQADMVVVLARPHSFFGGLFHRSVTAQVMSHSPVPVLVLHTQ
ncbi:universal stress protein [Hymenobacter latericus]|uniref:universal stress protein n=1 Tax=Hymenobacter sp. YIM 151858-1 TaxID=2987688 RepID=UPI0022272C87|nr:universal stress protein [Hymenobacter sp. YIM 151858-1]UYZ59705.1 universal stress protein [Hymenobacter sp. YIM 151858-1]